MRHIRLWFRLVFLLWFWNLLGELFDPILLSMRNITVLFCDGIVAVFTSLLLVFEIILVLDSLSYLLLRLSALVCNCPLLAANVGCRTLAQLFLSFFLELIEVLIVIELRSFQASALRTLAALVLVFF